MVIGSHHVMVRVMVRWMKYSKYSVIPGLQMGIKSFCTFLDMFYLPFL